MLVPSGYITASAPEQLLDTGGAASEPCVEVQLCWGARLLSTAYVRRGQRFAMGEGSAVELPLSARQLGTQRLLLVNALGEVTLLRDGEALGPQLLAPGERCEMACGALRFRLTSTCLPRTSSARRRSVRAAIALLLAALVALVALPLMLRHEPAPIATVPSEAGIRLIRAHLEDEPAAEEPLLPPATTYLPTIILEGLPPEPPSEAEVPSPIYCMIGEPVLAESSPQPLEEPLPATRYGLIELPPPHLAGTLSALADRHGEADIDWLGEPWPVRPPGQLSGAWIGEYEAMQRSAGLASLNAPVPRAKAPQDALWFDEPLPEPWWGQQWWQPAPSEDQRAEGLKRYRACMLASGGPHADRFSAHQRCYDFAWAPLLATR